MNILRKSLSTGFVAGALAASSLWVNALTASASAARDEDPFVATTAHCRAEDVHAWAYPAGYLRGEKIVCDILSDEPRIQGRITLQNVCPINGTAGCDATFRIDADSGARWEGLYWTERVDGTMGLLAMGLDDPAGAQIMLDIYNLNGGNGWRADGANDDLVGRITAMD